ncbi:acetate--CoA ligase family protein [Streptomyces sp. NPDC048479]|uniref:acetate--CoA ligase family protein n=1 Tax=Streptomyces sp. NPDC048479 TaxID=3154725 RepID=UPI0034407DD4
MTTVMRPDNGTPLTPAPVTGLFDPGSVAVVGASDNVEKWGHWIARGALAGQRRRQVHLVNRRGGSVLGSPCHTGLDRLTTSLELVCVVAPPHSVRPIVEQGLALGARYFVVITAGVDVPGLTAADAEAELAALVRSRGARLLGPNCMGVVDTGTDLRLSWGDFPAGNVGMVSQSGNLGLEIGRLLGRAGQGFSRFVSLGNQRDIDATEAIEALIAHEPTRVIAAYVEDVRDGRRFARTLATARDAGKPVLLLTVGRSAASQLAAASHTGALVSDSAVMDAVFTAAGTLLPSSAGALVDAALTLLAPALPAGRRIAVVGDSGGQGALAADALTGEGLEVPVPAESTATTLAARLPAAAGVHNPVDLAGAGEADLGTYAAVAETLLASGDADAVLLTGYFGDYSTGTAGLLEKECAVAGALADAVHATGRPLVVHSMARDTPALAVLRERGVPVYERVDQAASALASAERWARGRLDAAAGTVLATADNPPVPPAGRPLPDGDYRTVRALLHAYGVEFPEAAFVSDPDEAAREADRIGYPVVLKAMGLAHKTEAGGVALNLADAEELRAAFTRMHDAVGAGAYAVERMVRRPHAVELIVGVRRDPAFGPVAMVGIGGVTAELHADTALGLAPLSEDRARTLLASLHHTPLLRGWRGAPAVDLAAAARAVAAVSRAACDHPELAQLEVNPLVTHPGGACALDAHGVLTGEGSP